MNIVLKRIMLWTVILTICASLMGCAKKTSTTQVPENIPEGKLVVSVVDKTSKKPISDAKVILLDGEDVYKTDEKGQTTSITLKVNKDFYKKYGDELTGKAPSGTVTLLVSKDGYKDYVYFYKGIYPGQAANTLKIEMSKPANNDKQKYVASIEQPHIIWVQDLVDTCKNMKDENEGSGENNLVVTVKDQNSKAVEGVFVIIPELGIRVKTDKDGKVTLKPGVVKETSGTFGVDREVQNYTIVTLKDGYVPSVTFNAVAQKDSINVKVKSGGNSGSDDCQVTYQPFEKEWVEKLISTYKK